MKPDRTNYEIWFIDYFDGVLGGVQVKQLMSFLDVNPDLKQEFDEFRYLNILPEDYSFTDKNSLKKSFSDLSPTQFELLCVAASEGDLSDKQRDELVEFTYENDENQKTFELISRLKLVAPEVTYNKKSSLRKLSVAQKFLRFSVIGLSAAAGIVLMISLFNLSVKKNDELNPLSSTSITADSNKLNTIMIAAGSDSAMVKKVKKSGSKNVFALLEKTVSEEMKSFPEKLSDSDSSSLKARGRLANVSKISFMQEVTLGEKEFTSTLIAIKTIEIPIGEPTEKPGFNDFLAKTFRQKILRSKEPETGFIKAYEIADAGIHGLNKLFGWQMSLQKTRDEKGDLKSLYFSSKMLKFNAPVKKFSLSRNFFYCFCVPALKTI
jgi:hypothetical protein